MTGFEKDNEVTINYDGKPISKGVYNLFLSIMAVKLFCKGIIPHRNWRLKDVKEYFGVKGSKEKVLLELEKIRENHFKIKEK